MKIFELEQQLLDCWKVTEDVNMVTKYLVDECDGYDDDDVMNKYFAIKDLYEIKFEKLWKTFEAVCKEYHEYRKLSGIERDKELQELWDKVN
jgi:hypothetical protein